MFQLVATLIHLFKCRYECQNFGFWGLFLAGRFCVYITQMNFLFCPFSYLIFILFCFVLLSLIRAIYPIVFCAYCQPGRGGVTFDSLVNVPRCHITTLSSCHVVCGCGLKCRRRATLFCGRRFATLFALCVPSGGVVLSYFAVEDFAVVGVFTGDTGSVPLTLLS